MCGIVGYIGGKKIDKVLLGALSRLEYRGYDSAGIATMREGQISVLKAPGKLKALYNLASEASVEGSLGIGHTRWATHGDPSQRNAHPHTDCSGQIAVVHNGIIENHSELKALLMEHGHRFTSDTDTEVLAHLIEEFHLVDGHPLDESVRLTLREIEGSYAFCVVSGKETERFIAARNGSPLVVGIGENENFVASDAPAILEHTQDVIFLEDYQMADVSRAGVKVTTVKGESVTSKITKVDWKADDASKEGFDHYMLKEIEEQPRVIERMINARLSGDLEKSLFDTLRMDVHELRNARRVIIQACGTSWHAALVGKYLLEGIAGLPTEVDVSSEFRYRKLVPQPGTVVISITQSGETIDALMGLRHGRQAGFKTLAICNVLGSTISRESDAVIYSHAGPEIGVASTKAYTAQIGVLFMLALYWARVRNSFNGTSFEDYVREFKSIPDKMRRLIAAKGDVEDIARQFFEARDFLFLGRGIQYPNAFEGALKIKEIAYIHATGHPAGEMKHGPIALIDANMPVVALAPHSSVYEKMVSNIQEVKARGGNVIAITTEGDVALGAFADHVLSIPDTHEFLSPLLAVMPLQYLAYYVARLRGTDVDQPRNLAKSVTVE